MVAMHALHAREEQMSEMSEITSVRSDNPSRNEDIYEWIESMPLSRSAKNVARDFSDAVLMSEILKFYYPHLVSSHNYIPANSIQNKKDNWNTLNRKVLSKIDIRLSPELIDQLAHSQPGAIEKLLQDFRDKQLSVSIKENEIPEVTDKPEEIDDRPKTRDIPQRRNIFQRFFGSIYRAVTFIFGMLLLVICFWRWFSRKSNTETIEIQPISQDENEGSVRNY
ncbi:hypothetical protein QAD02_022713 [Eretmocerus hayati]|uniref:Uncharacterized protein n=1 Tax=Eretmocerus hayati TaxID=131215 RepID=A0ACC2PTK0_9HYME|nr:hypothetical protein QAD02_022713 [Eretmocerus hayati]